MINFKKFGIALAAAGLLVAGCSGYGGDGSVITTQSNGVSQTTNPTNPVNPVNATTTTFTQVEFLARPAIGEGLLFTNANLNTYNSVSPSFVAAALANPNSAAGQAAAPVFAEAETVLTLVAGVNPADQTNGSANATLVNATVAAEVGAFLPDVMRIDTSINNLTPVAGTEKPAYLHEVNSVGSPCAGRKLTDDVIDDTFQVISGGIISGDNVPYYPVSGNPGVGHSNLNGQTQQFGPSTFPFLAQPD